MNAKAEQKEKTHETILESAARLVKEKGIAGARVADVMSGAGLTVGGFYAHFASKESLVDEVVRRTGRELRDRLFKGLEERSPADRAESILKRYLSTAHRDSVDQGCPFPAIVGEVGTTSPEHTEVVGEQVGLLATELGKHLPEWSMLTRRQVALGLVALMVGGLSLARALAGTPMSDEIIKACRAFGGFVIRSSDK